MSAILVLWTVVFFLQCVFSLRQYHILHISLIFFLRICFGSRQHDIYNFDFPMNIKLLEIPVTIYHKGFCKTGGIGEHILLCPCHSAVH